MNLLQTLALAVLQGITEPFPVSSLGHAVLLPAILHWQIDEHAPFFLPLLTMLHLGTLIGLAGVFWQDWKSLLGSATGTNGASKQESAIRVLVFLVLATLPAVIFGAVFEHKLRSIFGAPLAAAGFLVTNGLLLIGTDMLIRKKQSLPPREIENLNAKDALIIGFWQCLAFFPGISRSGATMAGGLLRGLNHGSAARFSLLMAQPVVLAATVHQAWQSRHIPLSHDLIVQCIVGAIAAAITAWICSRAMLRLFRNHENWSLVPFGLYCIAFGTLSVICIAL
ncbi:UDP pyrophosphate phosphatase [Neokomagataea thailandica NBRC 106555]|uniref:Undecaprenyl-diphosphatase n=2 Tax=Neokomagataea TaxID=1223423 RepID=A0A4Y6V5N1_9PROT|nr:MULTISPECIES: undecaprenyl-diphosphate phosphatase [Neokomagataea]QDH23941.1 undecaprenyl-diphosphate phosphatase [Neokomagataea tanensis]GBR54534.1 UDP pyrophosphate phosphatase [Neokomagataea thailandica NBRC 106555]